MKSETSHEQERAERRLHAKRARDELTRYRRTDARLGGGKRHRHDDRAPYHRLRATRRG